MKNYLVSVGGEDTFDPETPVRPGNRAQAFINLREDSSPRSVLERVEEEGTDLYGEGFQVQILSNGPPQGGLEVIITGGSEEELAETSERSWTSSTGSTTS